MAAHDGFMTLAEARQKCTEKHSCFQEIHQKEHMCLPPNYIGRLKEGVNEELSRKLMKFCDKLQGVIVNYDKIELLQRFGSLVDETPFLHFDIRVNYIVFKPEIDCHLIGEVNKFGWDHIGCLVHRCFNASIARPTVTNGYDVNSLGIGSSFRFRVVGLESLNGVISISGVIDDKSLKNKKSKSNIGTNLHCGPYDNTQETNSQCNSTNTEPALNGANRKRTSSCMDTPNTTNKLLNNEPSSADTTESFIPIKRVDRRDVNGNNNHESSYSDNSSGVVKIYRKKTKKNKKVYL